MDEFTHPGDLLLASVTPYAERDYFMTTESSVLQNSTCPPPSLHRPPLDYPTNLVTLCVPVIVVLGTVGNILSVVVLRRRVMQVNAASFYFTVLAFPDLSVLYVSALKTWIRVMFNFELLHVSNWTCKLTKYTMVTSSHLSAWLVVALTIERLMVVRFPFKASKICCPRQAQLVTVLLTAVIAGINLNMIWASELVTDRCGRKHCTAYKNSAYMTTVFPNINLAVYSVVPFTLVLIVNCVIISCVIKNNKLLKQLQQQRQQQGLADSSLQTPSSSETHATTAQPACARGSGLPGSGPAGRPDRQLIRQRHLTVTLLSISFLWLVLTGPYAILDNPKVQVHVRMSVRIVAYLLMYTNHAINFYIYCLTGRKFRYELIRVFCRSWKPPAYHKVPFKKPANDVATCRRTNGAAARGAVPLQGLKPATSQKDVQRSASFRYLNDKQYKITTV